MTKLLGGDCLTFTGRSRAPLEGTRQMAIVVLLGALMMVIASPSIYGEQIETE